MFSLKLVKRNCMKTIAAAAVLLLLCFKAAAWEPSGSIEGRVTLSGSPPPESKVDLKHYPELEALYPDGLTTRRFIVGTEGGLTNVLVYLEGKFPQRTFKQPEKPVVLEHINGLFQPYVCGIQTGQ